MYFIKTKWVLALALANACLGSVGFAQDLDFDFPPSQRSDREKARRFEQNLRDERVTQSESFRTQKDLENIELPQTPFTLSSNDSRTLWLDNYKGRYRRYVEKLEIRATGYNSDVRFDVYVNGTKVGDPYVPGRDPWYTVTVRDWTSSIELRHTMGGTVRIDKIYVTQSRKFYEGVPACDDSESRPFPRCDDDSALSYTAYNEAARIARRAIALADVLERYASYKEYGVYLLPIKKLGARALALANARGSLSNRVHESLKDLRNQIDFAACYLDETFERDAAFEYALELLTLREKLDRALN